MSTPTALARELDELRRRITAVELFGEQHYDADPDDDDWLWVAATGHQLGRDLDDLEQHLAKLGVLGPPWAPDEP